MSLHTQTKELHALRCDCGSPGRFAEPFHHTFYADCSYCDDNGWIAIETGLDSSLWSFFINGRAYGPDEIKAAYSELEEALGHSKFDGQDDAILAYNAWAFAAALYDLH